jgi:hypothetical protein
MRRVRWVIVLLVLGAIVNVAVAWAIVVWFNPAESDWTLTQRYLPHDSEEQPAQWEHVQVETALGKHYRATWAQRMSGPGDWMDRDPPPPPLPSWVNVEFGPIAGQGDHVRTVRAQAIGWPLHSMWSAAIHDVGYVGEVPGTEVVSVYGIRVKRSTQTATTVTLPGWPPVKLLPTRVLWLEFAINTVFYALGLWLIYWLPLTVQRRWRVRRGLCPGCAYPIGASAVCTECGTPINQSWRRTIRC